METRFHASHVLCKSALSEHQRQRPRIQEQIMYNLIVATKLFFDCF